MAQRTHIFCIACKTPRNDNQFFCFMPISMSSPRVCGGGGGGEGEAGVRLRVGILTYFIKKKIIKIPTPGQKKIMCC